MKKIKIIRIITRLNIGGPAQHVTLLTEKLDSRRFNTLLISGSCGKDEGSMEGLAGDLGRNFIKINNMSREIQPLRDIKAFFTIFRILKKEKPDIVHTHTAKAGFIGRLAAFAGGVPLCVHTFHGHSLEGYFNNAKNKIFTFIERTLGRITDLIIAVSEEQKKVLVSAHRIASGNKIEVVPLGLELGKLLKISKNTFNDFRIKNGIRKDELLVSIIGRLVDIKNHRMFIDAVRKIKLDKNSERCKFFIIGDGGKKRELERYAASLGLGDILKFYGWCRDIEMAYEASDIIALTSDNEGTPVSLIQALAAGRPVVSTDAGGVKSVVKDGRSGYVVPRGNTAIFSERLVRLIKNGSERSSFGMFGRAYVSERFSAARLVKDMESIYENLIKEKGRQV